MATIERFGDSLEAFCKDTDYQKSVCMSLLQIGELTNHLSEDYKNSTKQIIDCHMIKGIRNVFAHGYGKVRFDIVWDACKNDILKLREFCEEQIESFTFLSQESVDHEIDEDNFSEDQGMSMKW